MAQKRTKYFTFAVSRTDTNKIQIRIVFLQRKLQNGKEMKTRHGRIDISVKY